MVPFVQYRLLSPDVVIAFFTALRQLGRTALVVHHVPKENREPYGSVYIRNSVRSAWYLLRSALPEDGGFAVALQHNKSNRGQKEQPIGLQFTFTETETKIIRTDAQKIPELAEGMSLRERIFSILKDQPMRAEDIVDALGARKAQVAARLTDLKQAQKVTNVSGLWAILERNLSSYT